MNKSGLVLILIGAGMLAGLFVLLKPDAQLPASPPSQAAPAGSAQVFELIVEQGQRVSGPAVIRVREGTEVKLRVTADQADELHLHGYDLHLHLVAGQPALLSFVADRSGRFEYELHHAHRELGVLEVLPP
ncbi:MAG: hypothetical protein ACRETN_03445 [Nevskiales bacterium]